MIRTGTGLIHSSINIAFSAPARFQQPKRRGIPETALSANFVEIVPCLSFFFVL